MLTAPDERLVGRQGLLTVPPGTSLTKRRGHRASHTSIVTLTMCATGNHRCASCLLGIVCSQDSGQVLLVAGTLTTTAELAEVLGDGPLIKVFF